MRIFTIMVVLLLITSIGFSTDKDSKKDSQDAGVKKSTGQENVTKKKTPTWPRPYKSTEEISVDSTVPFPTDI
ncbi:MAG: hypothetical protein KAU27_02270 [Desulfuromonadales bacterium]|nr:hypothetical protein [Desulfuromonadales bacterium]